MVLNLTELPVLEWSPKQVRAALALTPDRVIRDYQPPVVLPQDSAMQVCGAAYHAEQTAYSWYPDAVIIQGEPIFVNEFVRLANREKLKMAIYSPCYENGQFVQFRKFS